MGYHHAFRQSGRSGSVHDIGQIMRGYVTSRIMRWIRRLFWIVQPQDIDALGDRRRERGVAQDNGRPCVAKSILYTRFGIGWVARNISRASLQNTEKSYE